MNFTWRELLWAIAMVLGMMLSFGPEPELAPLPECIDLPDEPGMAGCICDGIQGECRRLYDPREE